LTLAEAKALLHGMQEVVVTEQIAECLITSRPARTAARTGFGKDNITIAYRAAFRKFHLPGPPLTVGLDGGYPVRNLQHCLGPESEHLLD
jgi:hypothetical protein